jgi:hypothetical protein
MGVPLFSPAIEDPVLCRLSARIGTIPYLTDVPCHLMWSFHMVYTGFGLDPCKGELPIVSPRVNLGQRARRIPQCDLTSWMDLVQIANWRLGSPQFISQVGRLSTV